MDNEALEMLTAVRHSVDYLVAKADALEIRVAKIEGTMEQLRQGQEALENRMSRIEGSMEGLRKGQDRQDRILEMLAARSLEHEARLNELARR